MYIRTFTTTDPRGNIVSVGVKAYNDAMEALTSSYREVGPFDEPGVIAESLLTHVRSRAVQMMQDDPSLRTPHVGPPPLPFD